MIDKKHISWFKDNFSQTYENEPLSKHTSLGIGGKVTLLVKISKNNDLIRAYKYCTKWKLPYLLMGGGTNLLVNDKLSPLIVLQNSTRLIKKYNDLVEVSAGIELNDLVDFANKNSLSGLEMLAGIPGTVGGAIYGNAGAYGQAISDTLESITYFEDGSIKVIYKNKCKFAYRYSGFKEKKAVILSAKFKFKKDDARELKKKSADIRAAREKKYPPTLKCPGSFFKNILARDLDKKTLLKIPHDKVVYGKVPAGYLLEAVGAKGAKQGKIEVADYHANLFINKGGGKAKDFVKLAEKYNEKVEKKYGIKLQPEVRLIGFGKFHNKKCGALGYGIEGKDVVDYLLSEGAQVSVFDQKNKSELNINKNHKKVDFICEPKYLDSSKLNEQEVIFRSAGIYPYKPQLKKLKKRGVKIVGVMDYFLKNCPAKVIGVTGTKGKGTTSTLIYKILKKDGKSVYLAGNIGIAYLKLLPRLKQTDWVVLELSSFQLIDATCSPHIAVVLNITKDHLDWHKNINEYKIAKQNIVRHQKKEDFVVINVDYPSSKEFSSYTKAQKFYVSTKKISNGSYIKENVLFLNTKSNRENVMKTSEFKLLGKHNWENISAAACAASLAGCKTASMAAVIKKFKGLEHRLELVGEIKGIQFYNDSFSTNPEPTIAAINSFDRPITLILGGYDKGLDYKKMAKAISNNGVTAIVLIGDTAKKISKSLERSGFKGKILNLGYSKMKKVVSESVKLTNEGAVVLLSPASASFDMFDNYKDRGKKFKKAVKALQNKLQ